MSDTTGSAGTAAFATLLDAIVPPCAERGLPGAGEAGLAAQLAEEVPELLPTVRQGLTALDAKARDRGAADFTALAPAERTAVLTEHAAEDPGFLPGLLYHTYSRYYRVPRVLEGLGLEARPPFPKGYEVEATDPERLDAMRKRPRLYREV